MLCLHGICTTGDALDPACDPCVQKVCAQDQYCCQNAWDGTCLKEADSLCNAGCCGDGECNGESCQDCPMDCGACTCGDGKCDGETCETCEADCGVCVTCPHSVCTTGGALSGAQCRDACVDQTCQQQMACCSTNGQPSWDASCSVLAKSLCGADACVTAVCAKNPACCTMGWTQACVDLAKTECSTGCNCAHDVCQTGDKLDPSCSPCAKALCKADPYCCDTQWDGTCRGEVGTVCGIVCQ
jgi:hypothetical protein